MSSLGTAVLNIVVQTKNVKNVLAAINKKMIDMRQIALQTNRNLITLNKTIKNMGKSLRNTGKETTVAASKMKRFATAAKGVGTSLQSIGNQMQVVGRRMVMAGVAMAAIFAPVIIEGAKFEQTMSSVAAVVDLTGRKIGALSDKAKLLGATTRFSATQVAEGMKFLGVAGFEADAILAGIEATLNLAAAGMLDLGRAADIASDSVIAFRLRAEDITRVADTLAAAAANSNTTIEKTAEALKFAAPAAAALGQQIESVVGAIGLLANAGIKASVAGTGINRVFSQLLVKSDDLDVIMRRLGSSFAAIDPRANSLIDIIRTLKEVGFSAADAFEIFGIRAARVLIALQNQTFEAIDKMEDDLNNKFGAAVQQAMKRMDNLSGAFIEFRSRVEGAFIAAFENINKSLRRFVNRATEVVAKLIKWIEKHPELTQAIIAGTAALGAMLAVLGSIAIAVGLFLTAIAPIATMIIAAFMFPEIVAGVAIVTVAATALAAMFTAVVIPSLMAVKEAWREVSAAFSQFKSNILDPLVEGFKAGLAVALEFLGESFDDLVMGVKDLFNTLRDLFIVLGDNKSILEFIGALIATLLVGAIKILIDSLNVLVFVFEKVIKGIMRLRDSYVIAIRGMAEFAEATAQAAEVVGLSNPLLMTTARLVRAAANRLKGYSDGLKTNTELLKENAEAQKKAAKAVQEAIDIDTNKRDAVGNRGEFILDVISLLSKPLDQLKGLDLEILELFGLDADSVGAELDKSLNAIGGRIAGFEAQLDSGVLTEDQEAYILGKLEASRSLEKRLLAEKLRLQEDSDKELNEAQARLDEVRTAKDAGKPLSKQRAQEEKDLSDAGKAAETFNKQKAATDAAAEKLSEARKRTTESEIETIREKVIALGELIEAEEASAAAIQKGREISIKKKIIDVDKTQVQLDASEAEGTPEGDASALKIGVTLDRKRSELRQLLRAQQDHHDRHIELIQKRVAAGEAGEREIGALLRKSAKEQDKILLKREVQEAKASGNKQRRIAAETAQILADAEEVKEKKFTIIDEEVAKGDARIEDAIRTENAITRAKIAEFDAQTQAKIEANNKEILADESKKKAKTELQKIEDAAAKNIAKQVNSVQDLMLLFKAIARIRILQEQKIRDSIEKTIEAQKRLARVQKLFAQGKVDASVVQSAQTNLVGAQSLQNLAQTQVGADPTQVVGAGPVAAAGANPQGMVNGVQNALQQIGQSLAEGTDMFDEAPWEWARAFVNSWQIAAQRIVDAVEATMAQLKKAMDPDTKASPSLNDVWDMNVDTVVAGVAKIANALASPPTLSALNVGSNLASKTDFGGFRPTENVRTKNDNRSLNLVVNNNMDIDNVKRQIGLSLADANMDADLV